ncbi:MAG: tRNA (guanosine(37)-N1)-methyltransferase TrmD [Pseudomonadales bacterium]
MHISVVTLFPEMFAAVTEHGISGRALRQGLLTLNLIDLRSFTEDRHRTVDDRPYGGGPGMVLKPEPLQRALRQARSDSGVDAKVVCLSPQGKPLNQQAMGDFSIGGPLILLAGRYEGIDERIIEQEVDEQWSLGDYVLSGGELAAMVMIDSITRLLPGALGDAQSAEQDSFMQGLLDYPHYTRPEQFEGQAVPAVLMSGNHADIQRWRQKQSLGLTWERRPDLLAALQLDAEQEQLLAEYQLEKQNQQQDKN